MEYKYQTYYYHLTIGDYVIEFYRNHNIEGLKVTTKPIGNVVTGVTLNMQGEQNDVDSPITKTSVSIGLINASDIKDNQMNGAWDFFAKAGEKEWEIKVLRESDDVYVWSGFITPDSYSEQVSASKH